MATQSDFIEAGECFLEHSGKKGMKWGVTTHKAAVGKRPVSRKRAASYAVAGAFGGGLGALGLVAANKALSRSEAKVKSSNAFKRGTKSTLLVIAKTGAVIVPSVLATVGAVAVSTLIGEHTTTIDRSGDARLVPSSNDRYEPVKVIRT
jgi:hypothetical protein